MSRSRSISGPHTATAAFSCARRQTMACPVAAANRWCWPRDRAKPRGACRRMQRGATRRRPLCRPGED
jgi:hypothetical protein